MLSLVFVQDWACAFVGHNSLGLCERPWSLDWTLSPSPREALNE